MKDSRQKKPAELTLNLQDPSTWTTENIDQVAKEVKDHPHGPVADLFFNVYANSKKDSDIPCNKPLINIILTKIASHPTYRMCPVPVEDLIQDVACLLFETGLTDWDPDVYSFATYLGYRLREKGSFGRDIYKKEGNMIPAYIDPLGNYHSYTLANRKAAKQNQWKYTQVPAYMLSFDEPFRNDTSNDQINLYDRIATYDDHDQLIYEDLRHTVIRAVHLSNYEMKILEEVNRYERKLNQEITDHINETIIRPAGKTPMSVKELSLYIRSLRKRANQHYKDAIHIIDGEE